jgi:2-phosphoglycerate kinase
MSYINNRIILIGGAPTVGKSSIARKLAERYKMPWISTDQIRELMRGTTSRKDYPYLFQHHNALANMGVRYLTKNSATEIVRRHNEENKEVWKGVEALIEGDYDWNSFIIEGIAILPCLAKKVMAKNKRVTSIFLVNDDENAIRKVIYTRGLWDEADKYPDSVKEKEVEWVMAYNAYIVREARRYNLPVVKANRGLVHLSEAELVLNKRNK